MALFFVIRIIEIINITLHLEYYIYAWLFITKHFVDGFRKYKMPVLLSGLFPRLDVLFIKLNFSYNAC